MCDPWSVCSVFVNLLAKATGEPCSPDLDERGAWSYARWRKIFECDGNSRRRILPLLERVPTILLLIIATMAMAKPF